MPTPPATVNAPLVVVVAWVVGKILTVSVFAIIICLPALLPAVGSTIELPAVI